MLYDDDCVQFFNSKYTIETGAPVIYQRCTVTRGLLYFKSTSSPTQPISPPSFDPQNELSVLNPSLTPAQLWQTVHRRVAVCITAAKGYLEDVEKERSKRYSNSGVWGRLVGAVRSRAGSRAGNAAKSVSDSAFDRVWMLVLR